VRIDIRKAGWLFGILAISAHLSAQGDDHPVRGSGAAALAEIIDTVAHDGRDGQLPPHLSLVLGLGDGSSPLHVKQAVLRDGSGVRVFNVSSAERKDVVILHTDEKRQTTKAYLLSRGGDLRDAVSYRAGGQPQRMPASEANAGAAAEIKFWTQLRPAPPAAR
jgi:hypothetical protein